MGCLRWDNGTHHGPCVFVPTDRAITELGAVMPNITHLTIGSPTCPDLQPVTSLSLASLSKTCRDLETLTIRIDFQTMASSPLGELAAVNAGATFDGTQDNACKLRRLVVGLSILPNGPSIAGLTVAGGLGRIFPSLSEVVGSGRDWENILGFYARYYDNGVATVSTLQPSNYPPSLRLT